MHSNSKSITSLIAVGAMAGFILAAASPASAETDNKTLRNYKAKCAACHGDDGKGQTELGKKMGVRDWTSAQYWAETDDEKIKDSMVKGVKWEKNGKKGLMGSYQGKLTPDQIDKLTAYVKTFRK